MMLVDPKSIIKRLTKNCTAALEAAVVQCVNARHYEVTLEHLLLALLDDANSDIAFLVMHYDLNPSQLRATLQRSLEDLRTGNAGKPVFSPTMLEWMQDAWLVGSVEYGFQKVRSGMLFARLVQQPTRYSMSGIGALLTQVHLHWALLHQAMALVVLGFATAHWRGTKGAYPLPESAAVRS